jgi:MFS family permease
VSADAHAIDAGVATHTVATPTWRSRRWAIVATLSVTETVSWGILYYAFAVFLTPMRLELGVSTAEIAGAFSVAVLVSGLAGIAVGRWLDRRSPRALMTGGSIAGVALVVAWSQVDGLLALYVIWGAIGLVMAAVLYEPAFVVVAKWFHDPAERRRAMTAMTLVAALASFIFLPTSQALIDAYGWRQALLMLAAILAVATVPLHRLVLRKPDRPRPERDSVMPSQALRSHSFWLLSTAFVLGSLATIAMTIHAIPFLLERGYSAAFAAFAVGLIGISQIPGRVLFSPLAGRLSSGAANAAVFPLIALAIALVVAIDSTGTILAGLVLLGMGNGMATLARAITLADHYGTAGYGAIAGVAAAMTTAARAAGPVLAALAAAATSYETLLWLLVGVAVTAAACARAAEQSRVPAAPLEPARAEALQ